MIRYLEQNDKEVFIYARHNLSWPVSDRDYRVRYTWKDLKDGGFQVVAKSTTLKGPAPIKGVINTVLSKGDAVALQSRNISLDTVKKYGVTAKVNKHIYPYYDKDECHVANKVRQTNPKNFFVEGDLHRIEKISELRIDHIRRLNRVAYHGRLDSDNAQVVW